MSEAEAKQPPERTLLWDGCLNVRDLGGLPLVGGGWTRYRQIVRGDNVRRLTGTGWAALRACGVRTAIDLRWADEQAEDPPDDVPIDVVHVPLLGEYDPAYSQGLDLRMEGLAGPARAAAAYTEFVDRFRPHIAAAIDAVAAASAGGVLIHCVEGKDRTGILSGLLLRLARVRDDAIADDYALTERNLAEHHGRWIADAQDERQRARRVALSVTPPSAMLAVIAHVDRVYGGVEPYLEGGGASPAAATRVVERLRGKQADATVGCPAG